MPSSTIYKLVEACREPGCPVCRLEQEGVERYLDNQFYENVNSPAWRDRLRASHGFCHEHAWLAVNKRLGDALGFSIIYHDILNSLANSWSHNVGSVHTTRRRGSVLGRASESLRDRVRRILTTLTPRKACPVCQRREEITRDLLSALVQDLPSPNLREALQTSEGLCLPHLRLALGNVKDNSTYETLLALHRANLERLRDELAEFIRKNDYRTIKAGFGSEGVAWLRAISMIVGSRRESY